MTTEMCIVGWKLRSDYLNSLVNRDLPYFLYAEHLRNCPQCKRYIIELTAEAEKAEYPEMSDEAE